MDLEKLKKSEVHVVGISGAEGSSLALFLSGLGVTKLIGHDFKTAADFKKSFFSYHDNSSQNQKKRLFNQLFKSFKKIQFRNSYLSNIDRADYIFAPSSWFRYPANKKLASYKLWSWYNLLLELFPGAIIGVTGTAGKGTVTNLIYQILLAQKKKVFLMGDSWHYSDLTKIIKAGQQAMVVAEVNNRVLTFAKNSQKSPPICVITNLLRHHLDDHGNSFSRYKRVKLELFKYQKPGDYLLVNADDPELRNIKFPARAKFYSLSRGFKFNLSNPYFKNEHLLSDALAAVQVAKIFKVPETIIIKTLKHFKPRTGRFEPIRKYQGVTFINDSAATRPQATIFAVKACPAGKTILILQGYRQDPQDVKADYWRLVQVIKGAGIKHIFISGQISGYLFPLIKNDFRNISQTKNLSESVKRAWKKSASGDTILLSPANESFGEFKDYRERSYKFVKLVNKIK